MQLVSSLSIVSYIFDGLMAILLFFLLLEHMKRRTESAPDEVLLERVLGAPSVSLVSPLAFRAMLLMLLAFVVATAVVVGCIAALPFIVPASIQDVFTQLEVAVQPIAMIAVPAALVAEIVLLPIACFIAASMSVRRLPVRSI